MTRPADAATRERAVASYGAGASLATIGAELSYHPATVRKRLIAAGVPRRGPGARSAATRRYHVLADNPGWKGAAAGYRSKRLRHTRSRSNPVGAIPT